MFGGEVLSFFIFEDWRHAGKLNKTYRTFKTYKTDIQLSQRYMIDSKVAKGESAR